MHSGHYRSSLTYLFSSHGTYFLLSIACVHSFLRVQVIAIFICALRYLEKFFISSTHCNHCTYVVNWSMTDNIFLVYDFLFFRNYDFVWFFGSIFLICSMILCIPILIVFFSGFSTWEFHNHFVKVKHMIRGPIVKDTKIHRNKG